MNFNPFHKCPQRDEPTIKLTGTEEDPMWIVTFPPNWDEPAIKAWERAWRKWAGRE